MGRLKQIFFDFISFNSPFFKFFNLSLIFAILASLPTETLKYYPFKCVFKHFILPLMFGGVCPEGGLFNNCNCPACGMTRGMSRLLHGDLTGAYNFNPLVFPVFVVMLSVLIYNLVKVVKLYKRTGKIYSLKI